MTQKRTPQEQRYIEDLEAWLDRHRTTDGIRQHLHEAIQYEMFEKEPDNWWDNPFRGYVIETNLDDPTALQELTKPGNVVEVSKVSNVQYMIQRMPKVGEIVMYHLVQGTGSRGSNDLAPAIITHVWSRTCVNLTVFPDFASPFYVASCIYHDKGHSTNGRAWHWKGDEEK